MSAIVRGIGIIRFLPLEERHFRGGARVCLASHARRGSRAGPAFAGD